MIPTDLQAGLKKRLEKVFEHELFHAPNGERVPLTIIEQKLPKKTKKEDEFYPLILVKLFDGEKRTEKDDNKVNVGFVIGTFDGAPNHQGYQDVTHIMNKIIKNLHEYPSVDDQFELSFPLRWAIIDEETEPYYHGGIEATFIVPEPISQHLEGML
ncbi:hypothetical protein ABER98_01730 [Domibacillus aminovorans]|uniref:hypothetical protein n=1 Tax=Domibacillus aminovorans TaxID=29332 RepID=UPI003D2011EC